MKYITTAFILLCFFSCTKDYNSQYTATFINTTTHSIKILFYKNGVVNTNDTIALFPNQQFEFANGSQRGNITVPGFSSKYFGGSNDSNVVIFDNLFRIVHYANTPTNLAFKYYLATSNRNIANPNSYRFVSIPISNNSHKNEHFYEFIEQDYLDAQ
jgi:hypothetical protein